MKQKIIMCNYYGMCDQNGIPVGHALKVSEEYCSMLQVDYDVSLIASSCLTANVNPENFSSISTLKYNIGIENNTIWKRILDKFRLVHNIHKCLKNNGILFFYQVDFFFFLYIVIFYHKCNGRKILCLVYHQDFTGGRFETILQRIYRKSLQKIDGVIYTQKDNGPTHINSMWMPDFLYNNYLYSKYQKKSKEDKVVCVGTMNQYKRLEDLVEVFSKLEIPLEIVGIFDDYVRYKSLLEKKTSNITIINTNLTKYEYLEKLSCARYSILPYDMNQYQNRTSGVLLESIYVGTIPIAPKSLLEDNKLPGIMYNSLSDMLNYHWKDNKSIHEHFLEVYTDNNIEHFRIRFEMLVKKM